MALPRPLTSFIGREREIALVVDRLRRDDVRLLTLTGPGGVGKTRLAIQVAQALVGEFPDGIWFVPLAPVRDPALVASTVARTFGVEDTGGRPIAEGIAAFLAERHGLLILDNFEHVLEAGPLVTDLLAASPVLKVMTTSRAVLQLSGEHDIAIPPLVSIDPERLPSLARLREVEAVRLFAERAGAASADFVLTDANIADVATLCSRLDGLPLAIELAAARVRSLPPRAMLHRLDPRLRLLTGGGRDQPLRLRMMRDAIAWSYDLLTEPEQALFRRLSIFVGGCTLAAVGAVAVEPEGPDSDPVTGVAALVDKSLLHQETGPDDEPRYGMLETMREFALEQLRAGGEAHEVADRHAAHFLALANRAAPEPPGPPGVPWLPVLEAEHANLRAALAWLGEQSDTTAFARLASALWQFWYQHGHFSEGRRWLEQALRHTDDLPTTLLADLLYKTGTLAHYQGDDARAVPLLEAGFALAREIGDVWVTPYVLMTLGIVAVDQGRYADAVPYLEEARPAFERRGYRSGVALTLGHLAAAAYGQGDPSRAATIAEEALRLARSLDDTWAEAFALWFLTLAACAQGRHAAAAGHLTEMLAIDLADGNRESIADGFASGAVLAAATGQVEAAARLHGAAEAQREAVGAALALPERATYQQAAASAWDALGDEAFAAAGAAGRALTLEAAAALTREVADAAAVYQSSPTASDPAVACGLTLRERDVLRLVAAGHANAEIAELLFISPRTVTTHLTSIFGKLGVGSRTGAVAAAHRLHLVEEPSA